MASGDSGVTRRAWDVVRLALLWPRRGGAFRRLLAVKFRLAVAGFVKSIGGGCGYRSSMPIRYGERELSFDNTLVFHVKMHRPGASTRSRFRLPRVPCISPDVDFEYGFFDGDWERKSPVVVEDGGGCGSGSAAAWFVGRRAPSFAGGAARRRGRTNEKILAVAQMQRRPTRRWRDSSNGGSVVRSEKRRRAEQKWRERGRGRAGAQFR
ncbi:hypothetical protein ACJRO7_007053 [Eucalyptus globulus]|uniref:Uncharacterized protein n=1 Tax=Eucalyptus globulus TaxID=34317 RepID=A0ABD3IP30_EUCGL